MGCNTSKETLQPAEEEKDKNENAPATNKVEENNVNEAKEQNEAKPPSSRTITIKSASNSKPNSPTPAGTNGKTEIGAELTEENADQDLEQAATKIQAVFRGHHTRRTMKQDDKSAKPKSAQQQQQHQQHQQQQHQQQQQQQTQQDLENEFSSDDVELTHAATKIQASFRGHMVRKQIGKDDVVEQKPAHPSPPEEELDIDLTDPELNKAATKIQASFRGHAVRKDHPQEPHTASAK